LSEKNNEWIEVELPYTYYDYNKDGKKDIWIKDKSWEIV